MMKDGMTEVFPLEYAAGVIAPNFNRGGSI
jgi:hypothetical protein